MTATVQAKNVGAGFGDRELFSGVDLVVAPGDVIGLVGPNGAGKSTLLQILGGRRQADSGSVAVSPAARAARLPRAGDRASRRRVRARPPRPADRRDARAGRPRRGRRRARCGGGRGATTPTPRRSNAGSRSAAPTSRRASATVADDLGLDRRPRPPDDRAVRRAGRPGRPGGAAALALRPLPSRRADQRPRRRGPGPAGGVRRPAREAAIVVVSHDREFLSRTVTAVVEIDRSLQRVTTYGGSYDSYLDERSIARRQAREAYEGYAPGVDALNARARMQRAWMEKGVRNARRKATDNDKTSRTSAGETSEKQAAKARQTEQHDRAARGRRRAAQGVAAADEHRDRGAGRVRSSRSPGTRSSRAASSRLGPVDLQLDWRDRVAVTGPNGAGKSTLLGLLLGRLEPTSGTVDLGSGRARRRGRPGASGVRGRRAAGRRVLPRGPRLAHGRRPHAAGQVRSRRPPHPPACLVAVARASGPAPPSRSCRPAA